MSEKKILLTSNQQRVFQKIKDFINGSKQIFILRGYAGTGKTTMIKEIADFLSNTTSVVLMAPTGRAARVLIEKTGQPASTIHKAIYGSASSIIKITNDIAETEFKLRFPINIVDQQIVAIVDEASMLSSRISEQEMFVFGTGCLMDDLLTFVRPSFGGKIIFVGDPAQLPPVGDNTSQALCADFFKEKGLRVIEEELTEVIRQQNDSAILKNAMQIRDLLDKDIRNNLVLEEKNNEVEILRNGTLIDRLFSDKEADNENDSIVICHSNKIASEYNREIRQRMYGNASSGLVKGDILQVVQNNYLLGKMNGEFVKVSSVGEIVKQSAPVKVQKGAGKEKKLFEFSFQRITYTDDKGIETTCFLLLDLLNNDEPALNINEHKALFINFCIRHPSIKRDSREFFEKIMHDPYYNCMRAKYGYAITGHKCQGGEWKRVYADYRGRTGLSGDCLRWSYTVTTRAKNMLFVANLPRITPFSKFRIEDVLSCSKINEEYRVIGEIGESSFHDSNASKFLHAKCLCIKENLKSSPYKIKNVDSKPYQEIYTISTPDGDEIYDIRYKKEGLFLKATSRTLSTHSEIIKRKLDNESCIPLVLDYTPSNDIYAKLFNIIRSACDDNNIQITNIVEHTANYYVAYYFRTSNTVSCMYLYNDASGFITYAKPMSIIGQEDLELVGLINKIKEYFA